MTDKKLQKLTDEWQKILRLEDWDITVTVVSRKANKKYAGQVFRNIRRQQAEIFLSDDEKEVELTIVHELLHVKFVFIDHEEFGGLEGFKDTMMENLVEGLAKIMIGLRLTAKRDALDKVIGKLKNVR